ncbi:MAG: sugar kinase [Candidatus Omnitrophica bacterium]|nr:sugar kinase [Candidatus Omnitrophota bacterium]MCM8829105.1 sugar kinase [Candidatus Omnitrophota bacterium]
MLKPQVITVGEILVEIMRKGKRSFLEPGIFLGPYPSGAPAIFISAVSRISQKKVETGIISVAGKDDFGKMVIERLKKDGVDTSRIRISNITTGTAFVRYLPDGSRKFVFHTGAAGLLEPNDIKEDYFSSIKVLHITGSSLFISPSSFQACKKALEIAIKHRAIISFDPNIRKEMASFKENVSKINDFLVHTKILFTTEEEISAIFGEKPVKSIVKRLLKSGVEIIVIKMGEKGSEIYYEGRKIEIPAKKVKVVDPTGAGDTYAGAFIACYILGKKIEECGKIASITASLKCTRQGPMSIPELKTDENSRKVF